MRGIRYGKRLSRGSYRRYKTKTSYRRGKRRGGGKYPM